MTMYSLLRGLYGWSVRVVFRRLPESWRTRAQAPVFRVARRLFPGRISARSPGEFAGSAVNRQAACARLPDWARGEVQTLVAYEPMLSALVTDGTPVECYVIPWDMNYVGQRYALARRQLRGPYACMVLMGGGGMNVETSQWTDCGRPLAIIDVDGAAETARLAQGLGADYVALPAGELDMQDHCAVLARLVLQLAPRQLRHLAHPVIDECVKRHGLALASVAEVAAWSAGT